MRSVLLTLVLAGLLAGCASTTAARELPVLQLEGDIDVEGPPPNPHVACDMALPPAKVDEDRRRITHLDAASFPRGTQALVLALPVEDPWRECGGFTAILHASAKRFSLPWTLGGHEGSVDVRVEGDAFFVNGERLGPEGYTIPIELRTETPRGTYRYSGEFVISPLGTWAAPEKVGALPEEGNYAYVSAIGS